MSADRAERRLHQVLSAAWLGLALFMAWAAVAPWIGTLAALALLAGSVTARWSLTRAVHRWLVAPVRNEPPQQEDQTTFLQADALGGAVALAGGVLVFVGVHPLGWSLVGLCALSLLLDAALGLGPLRWVVVRLFGS